MISPLIALMKDQVDALVDRGVKAANLDSTLSAERSTWVRSEVVSGSMKLLYVAPERLVSQQGIRFKPHCSCYLGLTMNHLST